jgi:hypothetical protein
MQLAKGEFGGRNGQGRVAFRPFYPSDMHAMTSSALAIIAFRVGAQAFAGDQS